MTQKTVLITGCSKGGIGDALARSFHKKGLRVFATARNIAKAQHLKEMGIEVIPLDVVDDVSIQTAVEIIKAKTGGSLDVLVNNSGGGYTMPLLDTDVSVAKKMFDVNVFAVITVTQAFAPLLVKSKGVIINIGSVLGHAPLPWSGYYNASKAAVNLLTDQMRLELSPWGIRCILVVAGAIRTQFFANLPENPRLPGTSMYAPAQAEVEKVMSGADLEKNAVDVDLSAEHIVANALKSNPKKHQWIGGGSLPIWLASTFGWSTVWDTILPGLVNLSAVINKIRASKVPS